MQKDVIFIFSVGSLNYSNWFWRELIHMGSTTVF